MPTARRRNRGAALAEPEQATLAPEPETLPPANMNPDTGEVPLDLSDLKRPPQLDFFAWIHQLPQALWGGRLKLYLYRTWPQVQNPGKYSNIGVYPFPIDEEFVRQEHGGGSYYMWLKDAQNRNSLERSPDFSIGGDPKLKPGQVLRADGTSAPPEPAPTPAPAPPAAAPDNGIAQIISTLADALKQHQDKPADQVIKDVLATMQVAQKGAIEIVTSAAKAELDANRPKNSMDQLKELLEVAKALNPPQRNSFSEIRDVLGLVKELRGGDTGTSFIGELKEMIGPEAIKDLLLGNRKGGGGGFDWRAQLVDVGKMLIQNAPMLLDRVSAIQAQAYMQQLRIAQATGKVPMPAAPPAQPQLGAAPVEVPAIEPTPTAAPAPTQQVTQEMIFDSALQLIVDCFNAGDSGEDAALVMRRTFPKLVPMFGPMLTAETPDKVIEWAKSNRVLSAIASHDEFATFLHDFTADIVAPEEQADAAGQS